MAAKKNSNNKQTQTPTPLEIITFTPVWQRREIFEICLKGIDRLKKHAPERFNIRPFFIVSENWAAKLLMKKGYDFIFWQNTPLGAKKNAGLSYILENYKFDYILEIGSDDLITNNYLDIAEEYLQANIAQVWPSNCWFIDTITGNVHHYEATKIIGLGRFISCSALKVATKRLKLWNDEGHRGMDTFSWNQLKHANIYGQQIPTNNAVFTLDIKSKINVNPASKFSAHKTTPETILEYFPNEAADISKQLKK
jgi:hypothetical protein